MVVNDAGAGMPGSFDAGYGQQPAPSAMPRGPSPAAGFSQPPADQAMMPGFQQPGFPQPSSGDPSSSSYPVAAPRNQPTVPAAYSQPVPPVNIPQQPAGKCPDSCLIYIGLSVCFGLMLLVK